MSWLRKNTKISPESLLQIPLLKQALSDRSFSIAPRAISKEWTYKKAIPWSLGGFNPLLSTAFIPGISQVNKWLEQPEASPRPLNLGDRLVFEVLFLIHDYLHSWAYLAINELMPKLGFGTKPINESNFEDFVFCHLVTESIATVGLDYWYLSTVELNDICSLGTSYETLTVHYREKWNKEYVKFYPLLKVQSPRFLEDIIKFYCTGAFYGFDEAAYRRSSLIEKWLDHEILYGETQRQYTRQWIHFFRSKDFPLNLEKIDGPVDASKPWKKELIKLLTELLWEKVKDNKMHNFSFTFKKKQTWEPWANQNIDMRFQNLNRMDADRCYKSILGGPNLKSNFTYFFYQYASQFDYQSLDPEALKLFTHLTERQDFNLVKYIFRNAKKIKSFGREPSALFFLN